MANALSNVQRPEKEGRELFVASYELPAYECMHAMNLKVSKRHPLDFVFSLSNTRTIVSSERVIDFPARHEQQAHSLGKLLQFDEFPNLCGYL